MTNETKFTVVISDYNSYDSYTCKYNSLREMLQDLFFEGGEVPYDEWIEDSVKYRDKILEAAKAYIEQHNDLQSYNALYIENGEIKELDFDSISDDDLITAYLTTYE